MIFNIFLLRIPGGQNDWVAKRYAGLLEKALNSIVGRTKEIEQVPGRQAAV